MNDVIIDDEVYDELEAQEIIDWCAEQAILQAENAEYFDLFM